VTIEEFINKVSKIVARDIKIEHLPMRETETSNFKPNLEKLQNVLDYLPKTSLEEGIKNIIKWYESKT